MIVARDVACELAISVENNDALLRWYPICGFCKVFMNTECSIWTRFRGVCGVYAAPRVPHSHSMLHFGQRLDPRR
jgi:hypothetical protein